MSGVDMTVKMHDGAAVLYPGPYLNQLRGERLEDECRELLASGVRRIVINFGETELINSIGISILLGVVEAVNDAAGTLLLSNLSRPNSELFEVLGLLSHVGVEATEEGALERLKGQPVEPARI